MVIIGWGTRNGVDYWDIQNTWGPTFGTNGYFKMRRGYNDMGMESDTTGCDPLSPPASVGQFNMTTTWVTGKTV